MPSTAELFPDFEIPPTIPKNRPYDDNDTRQRDVVRQEIRKWRNNKKRYSHDYSAESYSDLEPFCYAPSGFRFHGSFYNINLAFAELGAVYIEHNTKFVSCSFLGAFLYNVTFFSTVTFVNCDFTLAYFDEHTVLHKHHIPMLHGISLRELAKAQILD